MDCCDYGTYRAHGQYAPTPWEGYGSYAPLYAPYAHAYYAPHAHDSYARYYRYDYPSHYNTHSTDHVVPMDYGVYASKEARVRRSLARRDQRSHTPVQHLPLPATPPLECGMNGRGLAYCEPQMWPHYQMGVIGGGGWSGPNGSNSRWPSRNPCSRGHVRYPECRQLKSTPIHGQNPACQPDGRSSYPGYEDASYSVDSGLRQRHTPEFSGGVSQAETARATRERFYIEPIRSPPEEKPKQPVVPLPAFQQAFGSTEIGKFAEAFSRTEVVAEDATIDNVIYESFPEWESGAEPQWSLQPASMAREIKCEDNF